LDEAPVIRLEHVTKRFVIHHNRPRSFQELVVNWFGRDSRREELVALDDVSFQVWAGETVGIIGPNGAGKSTVLKLISRIIEPTSGRIEVRGRVGSLLELGAGFHPDLTGRENVYLNGSLLGFSRQKMDQQYEHIVRFAELERFMDMPVKHYSSGMYMRLGFSIAIHVDPDILLVDEVLAVGDQAFQLRCLDKINELRNRGVTILFVSHDLEAVRNLCDHALWLEGGRIRARGPTEQVIDLYRERVMAGEEARLAVQQGQNAGDRWGSGEVEITGVRFLDGAGQERHVFRTGEPLIACIHYIAHRRIKRPVFGVAIYRNDGLHVNGPNTRFAGFPIEAIEGVGEIRYIVEALPLLEGTYQFSATCYDETCVHPYDHHHRMYTFRVQRGQIQEEFGTFYIPSRWEHRNEH